MVYTTLGTGWQDGATLAEIEVARQLLIQDMKILEGIAPESGAYFNEVRFPRPRSRCPDPVLVFLPICLSPPRCACFYRLRDTNSTGRNHSSAVTTISSELSSRNTIPTLFSLFTRVSDQMSGTQISSPKYEAASKCYPTHWHRLNEEPGWCVR